MLDSSRRGFIAGLASLLAAPAIVKASSLMPVKPYVIHPDTLLKFRMSSRTLLHWEAIPGNEVCCVTGRRIHSMTRYGDRRADAISVNDCEVLRYPSGELFFKGFHEITFTYIKDGVEYLCSDSNLRCPEIPWSPGEIDHDYYVRHNFAGTAA